MGGNVLFISIVEVHMKRNVKAYIMRSDGGINE